MAEVEVLLPAMVFNVFLAGLGLAFGCGTIIDMFCGPGGCGAWPLDRLAADVEINVFVLIGIQTFLLIFLQLGDKVLPSNFAARKICHAGSGFLMLFLDSRDFIARWFVYSVVASSLLMTWRLLPPCIPEFRFGDPYDAGISAYLLIVGGWFYLQHPVRALAPLFFADPAGAAVGKWCSRRFPGRNPVWFQNKTVAGTLAVFVFAFVSLEVPESRTYRYRAFLAVMCALAEGIGGKTYDNIAIAAVVISSWVYHGNTLLAEGPF
jgi:hypothetical protein